MMRQHQLAAVMHGAVQGSPTSGQARPTMERDASPAAQALRLGSPCARTQRAQHFGSRLLDVGVVVKHQLCHEGQQHLARLPQAALGGGGGDGHDVGHPLPRRVVVRRPLSHSLQRRQVGVHLRAAARMGLGMGAPTYGQAALVAAAAAARGGGPLAAMLAPIDAPPGSGALAPHLGRPRGRRRPPIRPHGRP